MSGHAEQRSFKWVLRATVGLSLICAVTIVMFGRIDTHWWNPFIGKIEELGGSVTSRNSHFVVIGRNDDAGGWQDSDLAAAVAILHGEDNIRELWLSSTSVTDDGLRHLRSLTELKGLDLSDTTVTDLGLAHLAELAQVESLNLAGDLLIDGSGLQHLTGMKQLHNLSLRATGFEGQHARYLAQLPSLEWLDLGITTLSDDDLKHIASLTSLETLYLDDTRVSDAGIAQLASLPRLRELHLTDNPGVTEDGLRALADRLPDCQIHPAIGEKSP